MAWQLWRTVFLLVTCLMVLWPFCQGGKILVVPLEGSHWVNMEILVKALHSNGHSITVVRTTQSWYIKEESTYYDSITVPVAEGVNEDFVNSILDKLLDIERGKSSALNFLYLEIEALDFLRRVPKMVCEMTRNMFENIDLMNDIKERNYDLVLTDPAWGGGILLAHYLKLPLVYNVRWVTNGEGHKSIAPSPMSYIPMTMSGLSDKMNFGQRVKNMLFFLLNQAENIFLVNPVYQAFCDEFFGPEIKFTELMQGADLWLMRVDFVFEFPRPTMPNVIYMGGFHCKPAKPLPQDLEDFVQSSGEHGVIIMSLGTFVSGLPTDITDEIAAAFAKLPQKVIWRHKGDRPTNLGNNTLMLDWMPQNDLLGHPKIKLFVAHGGTNGVQEAIYHGVPVVGLPLFFDQYDNLLRLKERGGAIVLSMATVDKDNNFLEALQQVLHEPSYRMNMQRLSRLHRDKPMKPLDSALFWIEFVMRHKGAAHLRTESYKMPWYSYHSVDVMLFLVTATLLVVALFAALIKCLCVGVCFGRKIKSD